MRSLIIKNKYYMKKAILSSFFVLLYRFLRKKLKKSKYFRKKLDFFIILGIIEIELALTE